MSIVNQYGIDMFDETQVDTVDEMPIDTFNNNWFGRVGPASMWTTYSTDACDWCSVFSPQFVIERPDDGSAGCCPAGCNMCDTCLEIFGTDLSDDI